MKHVLRHLVLPDGAAIMFGNFADECMALWHAGTYAKPNARGQFRLRVGCTTGVVVASCCLKAYNVKVIPAPIGPGEPTVSSEEDIDVLMARARVMGDVDGERIVIEGDDINAMLPSALRWNQLAATYPQIGIVANVQVRAA